uniref:Uncharacterized protein n=1 Tax=Tanacetum cinerariifolium TaxID=118510 RepID=A0A6L2KXQ8_TANCI|nr:hypothetical protein [Tanacetum cinerariifolium]
MHKAFPLQVMEFPLLGEVPTASEEISHCQKKREATAVKIALLLKLRRNCQSKSDDSYTKSPLVVVEGIQKSNHLKCLVYIALRLLVIPVQTSALEVIEFRDSYEVLANAKTTDTASDGTGKKKGRTIIVTADDMQKRKNDVKARITLLLSLPDEHQLRLSKYKTAQELWAVILKTFGGNEATKKTKKNLLKQQYGNFKVEGSETLEQTFNRLQVIVSQLQCIDVEIKQDDLNQKFLTSLAPEWLMHTIVWRNRSDLDTQNTAEEMKKLPLSVSTASINVPTASANIRVASISQDTACAYIASQSSGSQIKFKNINQIDEDDMEEMDIKWNMALLSMRADRFWKTGKKISIQGTDVVCFDKSKVECFNCHKMGHFARECKAPRSQDRGRRDNFRQGSKVEEQAPKALMEINGVGWDWSYMANDEENHALVADKEAPTEFALMAKSSAESKVFDNSLCSKDYKKNTDSLNNKNKEGLGYSDVPPPPAQIYSSPKKDMSWTGLFEFKDDTVTNYSRPVPTVESSSDDAQNRNPSVTKTEASPSIISPKSFIKFVKANDSPTKSKTDKVETAKKPPVKNFSTVNRKFPTSTADIGKKGKAIKPSACNISYLFNYEPFDRGCVSFGQGGCKITGKGTIKTGKLEFENVYFVKDLKYNLFSVSQICDNKNSVLFTDSECIVSGRNFKLSDDDNVLLRKPRQHNMRLGHLNFKTMNKLVRHKVVRGLPTKYFENDHTCTACLKGKQHKASCKSKLVKSVSKPLHTLHMDLFGPTSTFFLKNKDETNGFLRKFITEIKNLKVKIIRCDNGGEFRNKKMNAFYLQKQIKREFSNARTPQQNGVAERRNRTLIEAARTMLANAKLPVTFWAEAINTACYVQNRVLVNKSQNKTPYELVNGKTPAIGLLKPFGCHVMILNTLDNLGKFETKGDEGYFIGYSMSSKAFRVFNKRTRRVEENLHVEFLENRAIEKGAGPNWLFDIDSLTKSMNYVPVDAGTNSTNLSGTRDAASQKVKKDVSSLRYIALPNWVHDALLESSSSKPQDDYSTDVPESSGNCNPTATSINPSADQIKTLTVETPIPTVSSPVPTACLNDSLDPSIDSDGVEADVSNMETTIITSPTHTLRIHKDHPKSQIIGPVDTTIQTKNKSKENVWTLVDCPKGVRPIGSKWVLKNKKDERGIVIKNKARLVAQGHTQEEGINYNEVFAPVARIESIRLFLAYASFMGFTVYQMDVKSAFMYGTINEEVRQVTPKECHLHAVKGIFRDLKGHPKLGLWYPKESPFDLVAYSDSDYGGATQDRKSTIGGCQFLEYVAAASCCGQVLWIQNQLLDYGDCFEKKLISVDHIHTNENVADLLTKPFDAGRLSMPCDALLKEISSSILRLSEHNVDFYPIVDFVEASPLRYALTFKPTVYVSHIRQFWSTARIETTEEGTKILATIDGILRTVTESSLSRNLKLKDEEGISSLPDAKLFENLTLMGYNISPNQKFIFQKGQFSHQWKYLIHTIMHCLSPKSTGFNEFSSNIATALVCLATNRTYNFLKMIFDGMVKNVNNKGEGSGTPTEPHHTPSLEAQHTSYTTHSSPTLPPVTTAPIPTVTLSDTPTLRQYTRRARIAQSLALPPVVNEPVSPLRDVSKAPRVTSPTADECTQELEINMLKARVKLLEDREGVGADRSGDDAPIKGRNLDDEEEEAKRVSDDTEEMATVLTSMDASTVLASRVAEVPTSSGSITTAGSPAAEVPTSSDVVPTASPIFATAIVVTPYIRRKGKEIMVESETPKKKKVARDAEVARIHAKEELQMMINSLDMSNETTQQRKLWSKKQKRDYYMAVIKIWKQIEDFIPIGSKEEAERFKRKGIRFEQESAKKLKTSKELHEEVKTPDEVPKEKVKEMRQLVPIKEVEDLNQLWALVKESLNNRPTLIEWKLYDTCGVHQVTSKDKEIFMLVEKDYLLKKELAIVMICYKLQVENYSRIANDLIMKIYKIANYLSQKGRIVGNKMHKEFLLPVMEFALPGEVPTTSEESSHSQKKREAIAVKIALLLKSRRNCQSKSDDSYTKLVPYAMPCILGINVIVTSCTGIPCPIKGVL